MHCSRSNVHAEGEAICLLGTPGDEGHGLQVVGGQLEGQVALRMTDIEYLQCEPREMSGSQDAVVLTGVDYARIARTSLQAQNGDTIRISGTMLDLEYSRLGTNFDPAHYGLVILAGSHANIAYCGFQTAGFSIFNNNSIHLAVGSTHAVAYNHWTFNRLDVP